MASAIFRVTEFDESLFTITDLIVEFIVVFMYSISVSSTGKMKAKALFVGTFN